MPLVRPEDGQAKPGAGLALGGRNWVWTFVLEPKDGRTRAADTAS